VVRALLTESTNLSGGERTVATADTVDGIRSEVGGWVEHRVGYPAGSTPSPGSNRSPALRCGGARTEAWHPVAAHLQMGDSMDQAQANAGTARRIGILALALVIALATILLSGPSAEAGALRERISGNFIDTSVDTNNDGVAGSIWIGQARGSGSPAYEGVLEVDFGPTGRCETGEVEATLAAYSIVRRYANGDQLVSRLVEAFVCLDPATGAGTVDVTAEFVGGTGRYEDATGTYTAALTIQRLIPDGTGGIAHGLFEGTTSGSVD